MQALRRATLAVPALLIAVCLLGCERRPGAKSDLEKRFEQIQIGDTKEEVEELLGAPTSKEKRISKDVFEAVDGSMKLPKDSEFQVWSYHDGPLSHVLWIASDPDTEAPTDVVYMRITSWDRP